MAVLAKKCSRTFSCDGGAFDVHDHLLLRDHGRGRLSHDDSLNALVARCLLCCAERVERVCAAALELGEFDGRC